MKLNKILLSVAMAGALTACDCDFTPVLPPVVGPDYGKTVPEATMSVLEFKQNFWSSDPNSCRQIGLDANGDSIILRGRVVSSDSAGNIYKSLVVRDETAALAFSINTSGLYKLYQYGQEIAINVTGMYVGTYASLFQVGGDGTTTTTFGDAELFANQTVPAGWSDPAAVTPITVTIDDLKTIKTSTEGLQQWQSQLVRIDGLTFENAGQQFAPSQNENRYLRDENGNRVNLRCSSYAKFAKDVIPTGTGSIVGILSYYGNSAANADWQVLLINAKGLIGFDKTEAGEAPEAEGNGSKDAPYNVTSAMTQSGTAWVKGYIVGAMNTSDSNNYVFEASAPFSVVANLYIAEKPDETNTANMLPVQLPANSAVRTALNLQDNPSNLHKEVMLKGSLEKYFGQPGMKSTSEAILDGKEIGTSTGGDTPDTPGTSGDFVRATSIADGQYIIWSDNKIALAFQDGYNYGYMQSADCTPGADGSISASDSNLFTFKQEAKGWTICDSHSQYLYQDTTHDSFQLTKEPDLGSNYTYWTITVAANGSFTIVNCGTGKTMRYDPSYKTYAAYADASKGSAVYLYKSK